MKKRYWLLIAIPTLILVMVFSIYASQFMVRVDTEGRVSITSYIVLAATESLAPTGNVTWSNLDGSYLDIDDDPDAPDANWADTIDNELDTLAHVSFPTPTGAPTQGAGLQNFKIQVKRSTAFAIPQVYMDLYEGGVYVAHTSLTSTNVTSDSGELFTGTWDATDLTNADGSGVEAYVYGNSTGVIDWVTPTGEVLNGWSGAGLAWDDDTGTASSYDHLKGDVWGPYIELTITANPYDQVRVWSGRESVNISLMEVDVYYNSAWNNIYSDVYTGDGAYATFPVGSTETISAMRIRYFNDHNSQNRFAYVYEADFYLNALACVDVGAVEWNVDYSAASPDISNTPTSINFGVVNTGTSYWSSGSAPTFPLDDGECYFTVTNNSGAAADITIESDNFTGGVGWVISSSAGENIAVLKAGQSGDTVEGDMETLTGSAQSFITSLADTASKKWELKLEAPTSFTDGDEKTTTVTLTASLS